MYELEQVEQMRAEAVGVTMVNPVAAVALVITSVLILMLPRKHVLIPFFIMTLLIPSVQRIAIGTLAFYLYRILIIVGWIRLIYRSEFRFGNSIDKIFALFVFVHVIAVIALRQSGSGIVTSMSYTLDMIGSYVLMRSIIRDYDDVDRVTKTLLLVAVIIATGMLYEQIVHKNLFAFLGGVQEDTLSREGRYRSQGSFDNPILAGSFGVILLPLFAYLYSNNKKNKTMALIGIISTAVISYTSSSSGPIIGYVGALFALLLYPARRFIKIIRWTIYLGIIGLHLVMKAPVWSLIGRIGVVGGSTSYHRYTLVDQFIRRIDEWWLVGTMKTAHWSQFESTWDIANEYVQTGVSGGIFSLILFIVLISKCFSQIGEGMHKLGSASDKTFLFWAAGSMMFAHMAVFMGVSYYGQMYLMWILTLALISALSDLSKKANAKPEHVILALL